MKRIRKNLLSVVLIFALMFTALPFNASAKFADLKRSGVAFNLQKGNWVAVYTKLPGSKKLQKIYAKITKYYDSTKPIGSGSGGSSGGGSGSGVSYKLTIQVQFPKRMPKKIAQAFQKKLDNGVTSGAYFIDYLDICIVDYRTGENLKLKENQQYGFNYKESDANEEFDGWKVYKPQTVRWNGGSYDYYVSYAKSFTIEVPAGYKDLCVGVCGTHISNYDKMVDWNQGFIDGFTVLSDTTHVKLGNKKKTAKLSHFIRIKNG